MQVEEWKNTSSKYCLFAKDLLLSIVWEWVDNLSNLPVLVKLVTGCLRKMIVAVFGYNLNVMKNHLYKLSEHILDIYQWIQSDLSTLVLFVHSPLGLTKPEETIRTENIINKKYNFILIEIVFKIFTFMPS